MRNKLGQFIKGHTLGFKKGYTPWNKGKNNWGIIIGCAYCGKKTRIKKYRDKRSKKNYCSVFCYRKGGEIFENRGLTPLDKRIRKSTKWEKWRNKVFERDNHICQICGERGGKLHPNHIKKFSDYPELRFGLENGITLCEKCHIGMVNHYEPKWESYFNFNLETRGYLESDFVPISANILKKEVK